MEGVNKQLVEMIIKSRQSGYGFFREVVFLEVTEELLKQIVEFQKLEEETLANWEKPFLGLEIKDPATMAKELRSEYARLFIGAKHIPVPLVESVYRSNGKRLFTQSTLDVREMYKRAGLELANKNKLPDDHIGFELEFMYRLTEKMMSCINKDVDMDKLVDLMKTSLEFMKAHILFWLDDFSKKLNESTHHEFYKVVSTAMKIFIENDAAFLEELAGE